METPASLRIASRVIQRDEDRLIIRPPVGELVLAAMIFLLFETVGFGLPYVMLTRPSSDWQPVWEKPGPMKPWPQHSTADHIATILVLLFFCTPFVVGAAAALFFVMRARLHPWIFDRRNNKIVKGARRWDWREVKAFRIADSTWKIAPGTRLLLELENETVVIHRLFAGKGQSVETTRKQIPELAGELARFTSVPIVNELGA